MPKTDSNLDVVTKLLDLAREFEKKGDVQSALMTYNHALSQLPAESSLRKEIEIIIFHLEGRSPSAVLSRNVNSQFMKMSIAFLAGLFVIGIVALIIINFKASPINTQIDLASPDVKETPTDNSLLNSKSTPTYVVPQQTTVEILDTTEPAQKNFLTIKSNRIYLRTGPDMKSPYISRVYQNGTQMEVLGKYNDWFQVKSPNGEIGWVFKDFVNIDPSFANLIPVITPAPTPAKPTPAKGYQNP